MFKKNMSVVQQHQAGGKDRKQLLRDVQLQFPDISEEEVKELLPAKAEVVVLKLSNKAQAYSVDGTVLFFDPEGRGDLLVPSVHTLWRLPHILPAVTTYSEVSPKVLGGADLFLQGFIVPPGGLPHFAAGDLVAVRIEGNLPFAVGSMEASSEAAAKSGMKGKGVKLLHTYPDLLWQLDEARRTPNAGFTPARIFPQDGAAAAPAAAREQPAAEAPAAELGRLAVAEPPAAAPAEAGGAVEVAEAGPPAAAMSPDELAEHCLLAGLASLADSELPIMTSDFYSRHMLPAKPPGATLDIKKSSYKKLSALLKKFEKKGLLAQKVIHKQDHIAAVDRGHELYRSGAAAAAAAAPPPEPPAAEASGSGRAGGGGGGRTEVTMCYRFPSSLRPILAAAPAAPPDELLSEQQVGAALEAYAAAAGLRPGGGADAATLDRLLLGALFNKKEAAGEGAAWPLADLRARLLGKLQPFHRVTRTDESGAVSEQVTKGRVRNILVSIEDRHGGRKHLTKLAHVEPFGLVPEALAGQLQRRFQTSSSVAKLPGKSEAGKEISLQGDLLQEVPAFLTAVCGISAEYITVVPKKKG